MKPNKIWWRSLGFGVAVILTISCGPSALDMMRDAMVIPDASAQDSCATNCTAGGSLRTVTAETDPAQLERGGAVLRLSGGDPDVISEVVRGPFVLTDAQMNANSIPPGTVSAAATLWVASATGGCGDTVPYLDERVLGNLVGRGGPDTLPELFRGARYFVGSDEVLCAEGRGVIAWAGFRPYE